VFVAFLRAVNVGGHGKLKMAALREALRSEGFTTATSYIQSGNLVLAHPAHGTPDATRRALEDLLDRRFGLKTSAVVLAADALAGALRGATFPETTEARFCLLMLLDRTPSVASARVSRWVTRPRSAGRRVHRGRAARPGRAAGPSREGCDDDGDGYCDSAMDVSAAPTPGLPHPCTADQASTSAEPTPGADCDDSTAAAAPGLLEVCDELDYNCDGSEQPESGIAVACSVPQLQCVPLTGRGWRDPCLWRLQRGVGVVHAQEGAGGAAAAARLVVDAQRAADPPTAELP
jgi:hypothetical protein